MRDLAKVFGYEPDRLVCRHPIQSIETREINRSRVPSQRSFKPEIKINIEVAHRQFTQRLINRLAIPAARKIRFGYRPPVSSHFENRDDVIGVLFCFEIKNQGRKAENSQCRRGEDSTFQTRRGAFVQNALRRSRSVTKIVRDFVQETLHADRRFQRS